MIFPEKEQTNLILAKYNHVRKQSVCCLADDSVTFLNDILLKKIRKKIGKFGLNYHRYVSFISFAYFEVFFLKIPTVKKKKKPCRG